MAKLLTSLFILVLSIPRGQLTYFWPSSSAVFMLLTLVSCSLIYNPLATPSTLSFLSIDSLNAPLIMLTLWITALMIPSSLKIKTTRQSPHLFLFYVFTLSFILLLSFSLNNMLLFYITFELSLIPTLMLIAKWGYQPERIQATTYLILYTVTASMPLLANIIFSLKSNCHLSFNILPWPVPPFCTLQTLPLWWLSFTLAFLVKTPIYSAHLWLPKAHVEAPVAGSMILAGLLLKLGTYGFARLSFMFIWPNSLLTPFITSLALWGGVVTSLICLRQPDMKSLIAYSSIGHMAILLAGLMSNSSWGWQGALTMMVAHGLSSSGLFAMANMSYEMTHSRSLYLTKGTLALFPSMSLFWFLLTAANMSAPPTINLLAEIMLISSSLYISFVLLIPLSLLTFLSAAYSLILYTSSQHGHPSPLSSPINLFNQRNYTIALLHIVPVFLLILSPECIVSWT